MTTLTDIPPSIVAVYEAPMDDLGRQMLLRLKGAQRTLLWHRAKRSERPRWLARRLEADQLDHISHCRYWHTEITRVDEGN